MDTFNEVSRNRQILDRTLGILLSLIGIAIGIFLIPDFLPLLERTPYLLLEPDAGVRHELGYAWFMQSVGWIIAFFAFRSGRAFLRDSKKTTSTSN
ncbi:hypothetical protein LDL77_15680 [Flagellimonas marinaquae]|jgi:hypothetical protein|uniref:Uncharacterized protein n=1 Tax=Flagellimonas aurea TaxID=2915619 RepID=A0ABS3GAY9_9FLAO|nr:hypothetical protein [Allomuricauda aurea]MAO15451.1 hypothetical protein [Allomuricauda sp.]MBO0356006.1 hypothetical protein [Allomuricauda aurea]UBZ13311.1 hypothetical protein LDL77_15680 [Allomuricauda aquimarina]